jgi:Ca-activated chloride channel family protein
MNFAQPQYFMLLILVPLAITFIWANRRNQAILSKVGDVALLQRLSASVNWGGRRWKTILWIVALSTLIVALARPTWGEETREFEQQGIQVMVALDVSESMLAEDVLPNRLIRARLEISDLMSRLNGDAVGLVLFSGASFIQFPLTSDYVTARSFLDNARPGVISRPGTAIGDAIRTAMSGFDDKVESQKVIILFTDGEDSETEPIAAAQQAADADIIVYSVGFGTDEGVPIPVRNNQGQLAGYKQDRNGETVLTRLDDSILREIAEITGGQYFNANETGSLTALLNTMDELQAGSLGERSESTGIERFQWFALVTLLSLILIEFIPDRKSDRTQSTSLSMRFSRKGASS